MRVVAFATIKMNSQRVPHKNLQMIGSKPLCWHILNTAASISEIEKVIVYCSDKAICDYIPENVSFLQRDPWLDGDCIKAKDTYTAFINDVNADIYIALCTTSPFTQKESLQNALKMVISGEYDSAFSAKKMQTFAWFQGNPINYDPQNVPRTQDMEPVYIETSAFFVFTRDLWLNHGRRIGFNPFIQTVDDIEGVDIDTPEDLHFARIIADQVLHI